jgi:hypothetical protein
MLEKPIIDYSKSDHESHDGGIEQQFAPIQLSMRPAVRIRQERLSE